MQIVGYETGDGGLLVSDGTADADIDDNRPTAAVEYVPLDPGTELS